MNNPTNPLPAGTRVRDILTGIEAIVNGPSITPGYTWVRFLGEQAEGEPTGGIWPTSRLTPAWRDLEPEPVTTGALADAIHASIHPDGQHVTVSYQGGDSLVVDVAHIDGWITVFHRIKATL